MSQMKSMLASFGRSSRPRMLGADPLPALETSTPACGFGDFLGDAPLDETTHKPGSMGNGVREGLKFAGILSVGALMGAIASPQKRGRNAAIGAGVGVVVGAGLAYYDYSGWKDAGGKTQKKGACDAAPTAQQAAQHAQQAAAPKAPGDAVHRLNIAVFDTPKL